MDECFEKDICPTFAKFEKKFAEEKKDFLIGKVTTITGFCRYIAQLFKLIRIRYRRFKLR